MKIAIDIDDTITNTKANQIILWKEYVTNNPKLGYTEELPTHINEWGDDYIQIFWDTYREILSFHSTYKEDVGTIVDLLKQDGHEVCIVTTRPEYKYTNLKTRIATALKENNIHIDTIYTDAKDKGIFCKEHNFDLLIDDDIKHILSAKRNGLEAILFNDNKEFNGLQTTTWKEIYTIIKELK